jgi:ubiquinone/menaquinone biosynthesis C-methylase UbiE
MRHASIRAKYERVARVYDLLDRSFERRRYRPLRPILFEGLTGAVLDTGVGTGCNMPFYAPKAWVVGVDLSRAMLRRAKAKAATFGIASRLAQMDITRAAFADASFDAAVATFLFCVLAHDDQLPALKELGRIVRPGGEIRLLEYTYSRRPFRRLVQRLWAPWVRFVYGAGFDRETARHVRAAGLITIEEKFLFLDMIKLIVARVPDGHAERTAAWPDRNAP